MHSSSNAPRILRPEPGADTLRETRWGGHRLATLRGGASRSGAQIGESWEFSTLPGRISQVAGRPLDAYLAGPLPFLAKLIDTASPLSVQVHPSDRPDAPGKEEAWMILDAAPDAVLWAGLAAGSRVDDLLTASAAARADRRAEKELFTHLQAIPACPGSIILVPSGTVHAIGGGILLAEIQQPIDATLRLYDYHSGRPLHVDAAARALRGDRHPTIWRPGQPTTTLRGDHLELRILGSGRHPIATADSPRLLVVLQGAAQLAGEPIVAGDLRLILGNTRTSITVAPESLVVIGACDDPSQPGHRAFAGDASDCS